MNEAVLLAAKLATRPGFDSMHDGNPATSIIEPYWDPIGFPTIGYGHLLSREAWAPLSRWTPITEQQAWLILLDDVRKAYSQLLKLSPVPLKAQEAAALIDFVFNCGAGNYQISTLRKCVNRGEFERVPSELAKWNKAGGKTLNGLIRRRGAEVRMFLEGV